MEVRRGDRKFFGGLPPRNCNRDGDGTHNQLRTTGNQCLAVVLCSCHHLKISASATDFGPHRRCSAAEVTFYITELNNHRLLHRQPSSKNPARFATSDDGAGAWLNLTNPPKRQWTWCLKRYAQSYPMAAGMRAASSSPSNSFDALGVNDGLGVAEQPWVNWVGRGARVPHHRFQLRPGNADPSFCILLLETCGSEA